MTYPTLTYLTIGGMIKLVVVRVRFIFLGFVMPLTLTENGSGRTTTDGRRVVCCGLWENGGCIAWDCVVYLLVPVAASGQYVHS